MTDKEQIIINDVDVSRCRLFEGMNKYHKEQANCGFYAFCNGTYCDYKKLARKTQECENLKLCLQQSKDNNKSTLKLLENKHKEYEELKKKLRELELENTTLQNRYQQLDGSITECNRYRKALEEIEKICLQDRAIKDVCLVSTCFKRDRVVYDIQEEILDIINKAKGEEK